MRIIIVGAGDIGQPLIEMATLGRNDVVVVERDIDRAEEVASSFDCLVLNDDATIKETLIDAGAERADALISTTDEDATNIMVCLLGQEFEIPSIVSVVHNPAHMTIFGQIGVNTIENPQRLIAEYLYRAVDRPAITDYMRIGETAEVFEIIVNEAAPIAGLNLQEANQQGLISDDMLIIAIDQGGHNDLTTPRGQTRIHAGDTLTVYSAQGANPNITDIFGHFEDHIETDKNNKNP